MAGKTESIFVPSRAVDHHRSEVSNFSVMHSYRVQGSMNSADDSCLVSGPRGRNSEPYPSLVRWYFVPFFFFYSVSLLKFGFHWLICVESSKDSIEEYIIFVSFKNANLQVENWHYENIMSKKLSKFLRKCWTFKFTGKLYTTNLKSATAWSSYVYYGMQELIRIKLDPSVPSRWNALFEN